MDTRPGQGLQASRRGLRKAGQGLGAGEGVCEPQESSHPALHGVVQLSRHHSPAGAGLQVPGGRRALSYREPEAEGPRGAAGPLPRGPLDEATSWPEVSPEQSRPDEGSLENGRPSPASALGRQTPDSPPPPSFLVAVMGHCSWLGMWESRAGAQCPQTPGAGKLPRPALQAGVSPSARPQHHWPGSQKGWVAPPTVLCSPDRESRR